MRQPGIEPGSTAWKAAMLTTIPLTLDNKIIKKSLIHTYLIYCKLCCISLQIFEKPFSFIFHSHYMEHYAQQRHCSVCTLLFCLVFTCQSIIIIKLHIPPETKCEILFDLFFAMLSNCSSCSNIQLCLQNGKCKRRKVDTHF